MEYPVFGLVADTYDKLPEHGKVINFRTIEYFLWVKIPDYMSRDFRLVGVFEMCDDYDKAPSDCDITEFVTREKNRPWIKILTDKINQTVGFHLYKIELVNRFTDDVVSLYFSYIIQNDNPDRPYDYMKTIREYFDQGCQASKDKS